MIRVYLIISSILLFPTLVLSQATDSVKTRSLPEIEVSIGIGLSNVTPYAVHEIPMKSIERVGHPSGVMGHLRDEPGIYGAEMGQGIVKPFIRGLGFSRVVTIYQGNKLENQQWGADHGLGANDLGIARARVIKGPASLLYGSGALGGVIVLEDEAPFAKGWHGTAGMVYNSVSNGFRPYFRTGNSWKNGLFMGIEAAAESHADYRAGNDNPFANGRIIGNSRYASETIRLHTGIQRSNLQAKLSYTYLRQNLGIIEDDEMEESLATTRNDRRMQLPFQRVADHVVSYNQYGQHGKWESYLHLSHHFNDRREIEDDFNDIDLGLTQNHTFYNARLRYKGKFNHTFGVMGSFLNNRNMQEAEEILIPDASYFENGLYYLVSQSIGKWYIEAGGRFDFRQLVADASAPHIVEYGYVLPGEPEDAKLNLNFQGFSGSIGARRSLRSNSFTNQSVRFNASSGFRAPDLAELFSNGPHPGTNRFEIGNLNFNPEQSLQFDASYSLSAKRLSLEFSPFINLVNNYIFFAWNGQVRPDGLQEWEFSQRDAFLFGGEFNTSYQLNDQLRTTLRGSMVRGVFRDEGNLPFIPSDNAEWQVEWKPSAYRMFTTLRHVDNQLRPGLLEQETSGFTLLHFGVSRLWQMSEGSSFQAGITVYNALNTRFVDHMSILRAFDIPSPGRNIMLSLVYNW